MVSFISFLPWLLFAQSAETHHANGWPSSLVTCDDGIHYNKACESDCNNAYESCESGANGNARIPSTTLASEKCSQVQGKCMVKCYAKAAAMCNGSDSDKGRDNINGNDHGKLSAEIEEGLVGVVVAVGVALILYLIANNDNKKGHGFDEGVHNNYVGGQQQERIGRDGMNEQLNLFASCGGGRAHGGSANGPIESSQMVLANNFIPDANNSMYEASGMLKNDDSRGALLPMEGNSRRQPHLLVV